MNYPSDLKRSEHPCTVCTKRKVKCDRLIPCTNCVKRGQEKECTYSTSKTLTKSHQPLSHLLQFWQKYEYWVMDIGLFKTCEVNVLDQFVDLENELRECDKWMQYITREQSFKLLDYSMERLGSLYFGCISDIGELYLVLEEYCRRIDLNSQLGDDRRHILSSDDYFSNALIWSLFTLAVHYMPLRKLQTIFPAVPSDLFFPENFKRSDVKEWSEEERILLLEAFSKSTITHLHKANYVSTPDVRILQVFLILSNTTFPQKNIFMTDSLRLHCFYVAKFLRVDDFRSSVNDSPALRLTKATCEKLWYRLCTCDYLQQNPNGHITFHNEVSSLLQHAAYLEDLPNVDIYQSENSFEVFYWKILSLDRDLDQYLGKETKPPLKTLDAIQRQVGIFNEKLSMEEEGECLKSEFEKFLITFLLRTTTWKLYKMYFVYHDISGYFDKSVQYAKSLIALIVKNIKQSKNVIFNSHFSVLRSMVRVSSFYSFYGIFHEKSHDIDELNLDIAELILSLPPVFQYEASRLQYILSRFESLKSIWSKVQLMDVNDYVQHPVVNILRNDVRNISQRFRQPPSITKDSKLMNGGVGYDEDDFTDKGDLREMVTSFESLYPIDKIIR